MADADKNAEKKDPSVLADVAALADGL